MYCNYSKDKFGNELTFIIPSWSDLREGTISSLRNGKPMWDTLQYTDDGAIIKDNYSESEMDFVYTLQVTENMYLNSITHGLKPQQARQVLPNATKTVLVMTGFASDWEHFFRLRALGVSGAPHPEAKRLAYPLMQEFISKGYTESLV